MSPTLRAALWMGGTITSFSVMALAGRAVALDHDTFEIMLYRSIAGFIAVAGFATLSGRMSSIRAQRMDLHILRNISHFAGQNLWFFALAEITLAQVFALEFTAPIWVILLSALVLGERLTPTRLLAALMGFAGILIVTRPGLTALNIGHLAAALAAIGFAGSIVTTKRLTRDQSVLQILFWMTAIQIALGLICAGIDGDIAWPTRSAWPWLALIGLAGLTAHLCLTMALSLAPASIVSPIDFIRLPVIALIGAAVYGETLDPFVFLGAIVIFAGNYINILRETRAR